MEGCWRYSEVILERPRKMTTAVESYSMGDLLDRCFSALAHMFGGLTQPHVVKEAYRRGPKRCSKSLCEYRTAHDCFIGQRVDRMWGFGVLKYNVDRSGKIRVSRPGNQDNRPSDCSDKYRSK